MSDRWPHGDPHKVDEQVGFIVDRGQVHSGGLESLDQTHEG